MRRRSFALERLLKDSSGFWSQMERTEAVRRSSMMTDSEPVTVVMPWHMFSI